MSLTDELQRLSDLHQSGRLTDREFAVAKQQLLANPRTASPGPLQQKTFRSSRWSSGNFLFPDAITLGPDGITFHKRRMFGSEEEQINYRAVASLQVRNGVFLADVTIETSGGSQPIVVNGIWKREARQIQETIRSFQQRLNLDGPAT